MPRAPEKSGAFCHAEGGEPIAQLRLWPHRSLDARGFVWFIALTAGLIALPLLGLLGSPTLWGILPFVVAAVVAIWWALRRNARDGRLNEVLSLWFDRVELVRTDGRGRKQEWVAEPYWVRVELRATGGPVEHYLTLKGGGRAVEIGAFLDTRDRVALRGTLIDALAALR